IFILYLRYLNITSLNLISGVIFILLPLAISIFLLIGFLSMRKSFIKFDLLGQETLLKIDKVNKNTKRKIKQTSHARAEKHLRKTKL
ncbi:hypothetical protein M1384_00355, partial [Candidatus Parvarchaeota archaeon]|nr:hypothetical protein [Candidatus Parvarchaeota archaeon]